MDVGKATIRRRGDVEATAEVLVTLEVPRGVRRGLGLVEQVNSPSPVIVPHHIAGKEAPPQVTVVEQVAVIIQHLELLCRVVEQLEFRIVEEQGIPLTVFAYFVVLILEG